MLLEKKIIKKSFNRLNPWVNPFILCQGTWPQIDSKHALHCKESKHETAMELICSDSKLRFLSTPITNDRWLSSSCSLIHKLQFNSWKNFFFESASTWKQINKIIGPYNRRAQAKQTIRYR